MFSHYRHTSSDQRVMRLPYRLTISATKMLKWAMARNQIGPRLREHSTRRHLHGEDLDASMREHSGKEIGML